MPYHARKLLGGQWDIKWNGDHCECMPGSGRGEPKKLGLLRFCLVEWKELFTQECDYYIWLSVYPSTEWDHAGDSRKVCETQTQSKAELGVGKANFLISWQGEKEG